MKQLKRYTGLGFIALLLSGALLLTACEAVDDDEFEEMEQEFEEQQGQ